MISFNGLSHKMPDLTESHYIPRFAAAIKASSVQHILKTHINLYHLSPCHYPAYKFSDIVTNICRASGMEGGTLLLHMIPK